KAEQDRPIRVEDLPEIVMGRPRGSLPQERLVPREAAGNIPNANDCPQALHGYSCTGRELEVQPDRGDAKDNAGTGITPAGSLGKVARVAANPRQMKLNARAVANRNNTVACGGATAHEIGKYCVVLQPLI